jgi:hypothetical protein
MSIIVTYPTGANLAFTDIEFGITRKTVGLDSPYTGKGQTLAMVYAKWFFKGNFSQIDQTNAGQLKSFLTQLHGGANKFRFPVPNMGLFSGYVGAAGLVNGAGQTGTTLITDGWSHSALIFKDGDCFTVNDEYKMVIGDSTSNSSGQLTLTIEPALRASPADNTALIIVNPTVMMKSTTDQVSDWKITPPYLHAISLDLIEVVE